MAGRALIVAAFIVIVSPVYARAASADGAILVLGKASSERHEMIVDSVRRVSGEVGWSLSAPRFSAADGEAIVACLANDRPWTCIAPRMRDKGDRLVVVQIELERSDTVVTVHVVSAATGADTNGKQFCTACDEQALTRAVVEVTKEALHDSVARAGKTVLAIKSIPDKAWISLDGKPGGATNTTKTTYPGEHVVVLRHDGYEPATRTVTAIDGKVVVVEVALEPTKTTQPVSSKPEPAGAPSTLIPKLAIGIGGAALVAGALMVVLDEDPNPVGQQKERIYNTAPAGVAIGIAGALLAGTGVYLWWRSSSGSPVAKVTLLLDGGALIGWSGRF
jgi:hypothetical protein